MVQLSTVKIKFISEISMIDISPSVLPTELDLLYTLYCDKKKYKNDIDYLTWLLTYI